MMVEGVGLMAVGMFTVFAFLTLLIALMKASAVFFEANAAWFPEPEPSGASGPTGGEAPAVGESATVEEEIAVAIALASAARRGRVPRRD